MSEIQYGEKTKLEMSSLLLMEELMERDSALYFNVVSVYREIEDILNSRISQVFPNYTLHNTDHSIRIIDYMGKLVPNLKDLSALELALLIYSALLHDIGMAATDEEIKEIKNGNLTYDDYKFSAFLKKFNNNETEALEDYLRSVHAKRSSDYVKKHLRDILVIPSMTSISFVDEVALICESHTKDDPEWITKELKKYGQKGIYEYNSQFCAVILRLADILDFDSQRTPPSLNKILTLNGFSQAEWQQHFSIENKNKIRKDEATGMKFIELHGRCNDSQIHRKILGYIDWINIELHNSNLLTKEMHTKYYMNIQTSVNNHITPEGYTIADLKFRIDYNQVTNLLMGEQIYGSKKMGLRELIQNAIDACKVRSELEAQQKEFGDDNYEPTVRIILDENRNEVVISDNGIGMSFTVLKNYFLNVGASYYKSDEFLLKDFKYKPIGNYGIGFLSCFMLSDTVKVQTRNYQEPTRYDVELSKNDEFVCINHNNDVGFDGTKVILKYDQVLKVWDNDVLEFIQFLNNRFLSDDIEILLVNKKEKSIVPLENSLYKTLSYNGKEKVILSEYLTGITGEVFVKNPAKRLIKTDLTAIPIKGDLYYFDGSNLKEFKKTGKSIFDFIRDDKLKVINIPIIGNREEFEIILEVLDDDISDAVDRFLDIHGGPYISILTEEEHYQNAIIGTFESGEWIFEDEEQLEFEILEKFGQEAEYTVIEKEEIGIFTNNLNPPSFLLLEDKKPLYGFDSSKLYIRGIYVQDFDLSLDFSLVDLDFDTFKINILNPNIIPTLSRNNLIPDDLELVLKSVYQAIGVVLLNIFKDYPTEKELVISYFKKYHNLDTGFLKNNPFR
ncbi:ATP-binding protein [Peribacillus frigoritolerans]|uniref:HD domain-containing protein n=1 Tax=Peribacillus frigoritolerans TaxID=450367 RepID=UPI0024C1947C|nr:ATP-binding protein [Peribacillus frigoritolerans]WHX68769.1 ATP-binding protein [Peribacillus frigoritolerans]